MGKLHIHKSDDGDDVDVDVDVDVDDDMRVAEGCSRSVVSSPTALPAKLPHVPKELLILWPVMMMMKFHCKFRFVFNRENLLRSQM